MRKVLLSMLLMGLLVLGAQAVAAQDDVTAIQVGSDWVEGSLDNDEFELKFGFEGNEGDIVIVEMIPVPGTFDLDPMVTLRDGDGDILGTNDDFGYPISVVVAELPASESYVILASRAGGADGSSEGDFWIRVRTVDLVESGDTLEATITSVSEDEVPNMFVMRPEEDGEYTFTFSQEISELYASFRVSSWENDDWETLVASLDNTAAVSSASLTVELEEGTFYIVRVDRSFGSFVFDEMEATVTVSVE
jgi:hypothetical protein